MARQVDAGNEIREHTSLGQQDADLIVFILVVLAQFLTDLWRADHGILVGIIFRIALEDLNADGALFDAVGAVLQVGLYDVAQQGLASFAGPEVPALQQADELFANGRIVQCRRLRRVCLQAVVVRSEAPV
jgi:hypothetical protein